MHTREKRFVILGAGPAGLTAAYELSKHGLNPLVLEKGPIVGGLARTENYKNFYFDMGGHRFFTKSKEVNAMWQEVLAEQFLRRSRLSRIYYKKKFFHYPLKPLNALLGLGLINSVLILLSYIRWQIYPYRREDTFEQWVTNRFGKRLFQTFFKSYTEKVWGIPCSELKAEWAAQRIKDLSLKTAVLNMFLKPKTRIKTLIEAFDYPRLGPGMMWNAVKDQVEEHGGSVRLNAEVAAIHRTGNRIDSVVLASNGSRERIEATDFISSMPVTEVIKKLDPPAPAEVSSAAQQLHYRDFLTVCLIVDKPDLFPDNWVYIHDPDVKVGRIQNFKNWSAHMVPDLTKTSLGLEYFCTEGDDLWNASDADLIERGKREIAQIGLARYEDVEDACVFRVPKAYPIYDADYGNYLSTVRQFVNGFENFQTIGRNGLHRYNNQDHAMMTGMLAVRNAVLGEKNDLWSVNTDMEYHEEVTRETGLEPAVVEEAVQAALSRVFMKLDPVAMGLAVGFVLGTLLFVGTIGLVLKGGELVGPNLGLLGQYFPGYRVTAMGSVIGLGYGAVAGFIGGWAFAFLRNASVFFYMGIIHRRAEFQLLRKLADYF